MNKAKVGIFGGSATEQLDISDHLGDEDNIVYTSAIGFDESLAVIAGMPQGEIDVAVVAMTFSPEVHDGHESAAVAATLREKYGGTIAIVGYSNDEVEQSVDYTMFTPDNLRDINFFIAQL